MGLPQEAQLTAEAFSEVRVSVQLGVLVRRGAVRWR